MTPNDVGVIFAGIGAVAAVVAVLLGWVGRLAGSLATAKAEISHLKRGYERQRGYGSKLEEITTRLAILEEHNKSQDMSHAKLEEAVEKVSGKVDGTRSAIDGLGFKLEAYVAKS